MRAVHVHRIGGIGGSERHLLALLPALSAEGVEVRFVGLDDPSRAPEPFYEALASAGVAFERLSCPRDLDPVLARRLAHLLRTMRPDLVHTHLVHADLYGALAARRTGAALVSTKHNDDRFREGAFRHVERLLVRGTDRVICITRSLAEFCRDRVGLPAEKLRVVHYGLDGPPPAWDGPVGPDLPAGTRVVLAVSRLERQKGLDIGMLALARLRETYPEAALVVLGEGPERPRLEALASRLGLGGAVHLPGRVGDVAAWLGRAELLVHPARWEGFGLAVLEAMLCARPVVAAAVSSIPEIVVDGETGLLVPTDDVDRLAEAVGALLADPARAAMLGAAGLRRARDEFSVALMTERTLAVYDEALASSRL